VDGDDEDDSDLVWDAAARSAVRNPNILSRRKKFTVDDIFAPMQDEVCDPEAPGAILGVTLFRGTYAVEVCRRILPLIEQELFNSLQVLEFDYKDRGSHELFKADVDIHSTFNAFRIILYFAYEVTVPYHYSTRDNDLRAFMLTRMFFRDGNKLRASTEQPVEVSVSDAVRFTAKMAFIFGGMNSASVTYAEAESFERQPSEIVHALLAKTLPKTPQRSLFSERIYPEMDDDRAFDGSKTLALLAELSYDVACEMDFRYEATRHPELHVQKQVLRASAIPDATQNREVAKHVKLPEMEFKYLSVRDADGIVTVSKRSLKPDGAFGNNRIYQTDDYAAAAKTPLVTDLHVLDVFTSSGYDPKSVCAWLTSPLRPAVLLFAHEENTMSSFDVQALAASVRQNLAEVQEKYILFGGTIKGYNE
jgi:hypothetical protein